MAIEPMVSMIRYLNAFAKKGVPDSKDSARRYTFYKEGEKPVE